MPERREVDDREAAVTEQDTRVAISPRAMIVRAAMNEAPEHVVEGARRRIEIQFPRKPETRDSTHDQLLSEGST